MAILVHLMIEGPSDLLPLVSEGPVATARYLYWQGKERGVGALKEQSLMH
jgi:hypothetical protein